MNGSRWLALLLTVLATSCEPPAGPRGQAGKGKAVETAEDWADLSKGEAYREGDIGVLVTHVGVTTIEILALGRPADSDKPFLVLRVQVTNYSDKRKYDFRGWSQSVLYAPTLKDELGNKYETVDFGFGTEIPGQTSSATLYAKQPVADLLVFQKPVAGAKELFLTLPAANFGGKGAVRFRFAADLSDFGGRKRAAPEAAKGPPVEDKVKPRQPSQPNPEARAALKMQLAKDLLKAGKKERAAERLKEVVRDFPDTAAAKEAAELLKTVLGH